MHLHNQQTKTFKMKKLSFIKIVFLAFGILTLQSCFVAKDYKRPDVNVADNYRTDKISNDTSSIANVSWRTLFTDPVLEKYIDQGLQNNIDIRIAIQQILAAEAYMKQGKAGYLPSLSANAQYSYQKPAKNSQLGSVYNGSINQFELSGGLSWEADIWGKIRSNDLATQASYLQTVAAHKAVKTRLIANIASTYFNLLALDEQMEVTKNTISTRENGLETTKALKEAGEVTEVGVQQTDAQLYTAKAILLDLKKQSRILENSFAILLGENPKTFVRSALKNQVIDVVLTTGVPSQLLSNRPDVIAAEYNLRNAFQLTNVAKSNFYPSLVISANGGLQNLQLDQLFNANSLFASAVAGLTQPIFNKRKIRTQYEVSLISQEQARLNFTQTLLVASKEVSDAMYAYEIASEKIEIKQKEYNAYNLATQYSEELLNNGLANYLEVLTARENALSSSLDIVNAKNSKLQAVVDLYEALGGGWK